MNNNRLPKIIFNWDYSSKGNTWSSNIKSIFDDIDCQIEFISKNSYEVEPYALSFMNRKHRSYLAQYRCGILQLSIETGRWGEAYP